MTPQAVTGRSRVMVAALARTSFGIPDLGAFRRRYPLTVANLGALANREAWLRRIWETDTRWQARRQNSATPPEILIASAPPAGLETEAEFDAIYAGGGLGLLHAATLAHCYGQRVLVCEAHATGPNHYLWHLSDDDWQHLADLGLFTPDELQTAVVNRPHASLVRFHQAQVKIKAPPLQLDNIRQVTLDAPCLLRLTARKLQDANSLLLNGVRLTRAYRHHKKIWVETEEARTGRRRLFAARLLADATGANSLLAQQLNPGRALTYFPLAGTVARGFATGDEPRQVAFNTHEIIVSTEDAADGQQFFWHGLAGSPQQGEYQTCLFSCGPDDASLLELFECYFGKLHQYKQPGAHWRVVRPVFGYRPGYGWHNPQTAADRVLLLGDAAGAANPLNLSGGYLRALPRQTALTAQALANDTLDQAFLAGIQPRQPHPAQMAGLAALLRPLPESSPQEVNETLNALLSALHSSDENIRRDFVQGRLDVAPLTRLLMRTARTYPPLAQRLRARLGIRGAFRWLAGLVQTWWHESPR